MQRIVPNIWFDHTKMEAAEFYTSVFPDSRILRITHYPEEGLPEFQRNYAGKVLTVEFELSGFRFVGINGGSETQPNPSISFMLNFDASEPDAAARLDRLWESLSDGGKALMPLQEYPFSPRFGWLEDRFGVSWQFMLDDSSDGPHPFIVPTLMFCNRAQNLAGEALDLYTSIFDGEVLNSSSYEQQTGPAVPGAIQFATVELLGQRFFAMDSSAEHDFTFNAGVSLMVEVADQVELDRYWDRLSAVPAAEQCGWCQDQFGVNWQVVPRNINELLDNPDAYRKLLGMGRIEIAELESA